MVLQRPSDEERPQQTISTRTKIAVARGQLPISLQLVGLPQNARLASPLARAADALAGRVASTFACRRCRLRQVCAKPKRSRNANARLVVVWNSARVGTSRDTHVVDLTGLAGFAFSCEMRA